MEAIVFFFLLTAAVVGGNIIYTIIKNRQVSNLLFQFAQKYGLRFMTIPTVSGTIDSFPLNIEKYTFTTSDSRVPTLEFAIDISQGNLSAFSISAEGFFSQMRKIIGKNDILIGDPAFDDGILIQSYDTQQMQIVLNKKARSIISEFFNFSYGKNIRINESKIIFYVQYSNVQSLKDIEHILDNLIILAKIFCRKGNPVDLLKENYLSETKKGVKKQLLNTLYSLKGSLPHTDPVIISALTDKSAEVQFSGTRLLKKKGYNHLKNLYKSGNVYIKNLIINHLKNESEPYFLDFFLEQAERESSTAVKQELAEYFKMTGDAKAESFLRKELLLKRSYETIPDFTSYKRKIIEALKHCGTYKSIEPLYNIKQLTLKREADEAIAMIQDRIGSGDKGWLSITSDTNDGGKLSLTDEQDGND